MGKVPGKSEREYQSDRIVVSFDRRLCIHAEYCVRGLPAVFDRGVVPWVRPDRAGPDEIAQVVERCPTGALHFRRLDGGPEEPEPVGEASVTAVPNGPLYVRGVIEVRGPDGDLIRRDTRMALCRCGLSRNKPFCDNSHAAGGFRAE